jgi:hypothetical protein
VKRAPAKPACEGADPVAFDQTEYQNTSHGLNICANCPVRAWCLDQVDPAQSFFDGIAGGHVWIGGKIKWTIPNDEIARNYLERRNISTVWKQRFEPNMVQRFLNGEAEPMQLSTTERIAAAKKIYQDGNLTREQVAQRTGLSNTSLARVIPIDRDRTSKAWETKWARIEEAQAAIPETRLDHVAIAEFVLGKRKWYTLNTTERCFAASQIKHSRGKPLSHALEIAHVTIDQYRQVIPA